MEFQEKRKIRKRIYSRTSFFIVLVILVVLIKPTWNIVQKYYVTNSGLEKTESRLEELKNRELQLKAEIKNLESRLGVEKEMLSKFDLAREGGQVAIIFSQEDAGDTAEEERGFWTKLKDFFFGIF